MAKLQTIYKCSKCQEEWIYELDESFKCDCGSTEYTDETPTLADKIEMLLTLESQWLAINEHSISKKRGDHKTVYTLTDGSTISLDSEMCC